MGDSIKQTAQGNKSHDREEGGAARGQGGLQQKGYLKEKDKEELGTKTRLGRSSVDSRTATKATEVREHSRSRVLKRSDTVR